MKRTFHECLALFPNAADHDRWVNAVCVRAGLEGLTADQIEARFARWEQLEAADNEQRARVAGNRSPVFVAWTCSSCCAAPAVAAFDGSSWCRACLARYQAAHPPRADDPTRVDHAPSAAPGVWTCPGCGVTGGGDYCAACSYAPPAPPAAEEELRLLRAIAQRTATIHTECGGSMDDELRSLYEQLAALDRRRAPGKGGA